jgi:hypothetical protein
MERVSVVKEYFGLRDYLNRANKLSNQKTELKFEIEQNKLFEFRLYAVSYVISIRVQESHKIAIAERTANRTWERTGHTRFRNLEEFCAQFLNQQEEHLDAFHKLREPSDKILKEWSEQITETMKMLLLNKNYEP